MKRKPNAHRSSPLPPANLLPSDPQSNTLQPRRQALQRHCQHRQVQRETSSGANCSRSPQITHASQLSQFQNNSKMQHQSNQHHSILNNETQQPLMFMLGPIRTYDQQFIRKRVRTRIQPPHSQTTLGKKFAQINADKQKDIEQEDMEVNGHTNTKEVQRTKTLSPRLECQGIKSALVQPYENPAKRNKTTVLSQHRLHEFTDCAIHGNNYYHNSQLMQKQKLILVDDPEADMASSGQDDQATPIGYSGPIYGIVGILNKQKQIDHIDQTRDSNNVQTASLHQCDSKIMELDAELVGAGSNDCSLVFVNGSVKDECNNNASTRVTPLGRLTNTFQPQINGQQPVHRQVIIAESNSAKKLLQDSLIKARNNGREQFLATKLNIRTQGSVDVSKLPLSYDGKVMGNDAQDLIRSRKRNRSKRKEKTVVSPIACVMESPETLYNTSSPIDRGFPKQKKNPSRGNSRSKCQYALVAQVCKQASHDIVNSGIIQTATAQIDSSAVILPGDLINPTQEAYIVQKHNTNTSNSPVKNKIPQIIKTQYLQQPLGGQFTDSLTDNYTMNLNSMGNNSIAVQENSLDTTSCIDFVQTERTGLDQDFLRRGGQKLLPGERAGFGMNAINSRRHSNNDDLPLNVVIDPQQFKRKPPSIQLTKVSDMSPTSCKNNKSGSRLQNSTLPHFAQQNLNVERQNTQISITSIRDPKNETTTKVIRLHTPPQGQFQQPFNETNDSKEEQLFHDGGHQPTNKYSTVPYQPLVQHNSHITNIELNTNGQVSIGNFNHDQQREKSSQINPKIPSGKLSSNTQTVQQVKESAVNNIDLNSIMLIQQSPTNQQTHQQNQRPLLTSFEGSMGVYSGELQHCFSSQFVQTIGYPQTSTVQTGALHLRQRNNLSAARFYSKTQYHQKHKELKNEQKSMPRAILPANSNTWLCKKQPVSSPQSSTHNQHNMNKPAVMEIPSPIIDREDCMMLFAGRAQLQEKPSLPLQSDIIYPEDVKRRRAQLRQKQGLTSNPPLLKPQAHSTVKLKNSLPLVFGSKEQSGSIMQLVPNNGHESNISQRVGTMMEKPETQDQAVGSIKLITHQSQPSQKALEGLDGMIETSNQTLNNGKASKMNKNKMRQSTQPIFSKNSILVKNNDSHEADQGDTAGKLKENSDNMDNMDHMREEGGIDFQAQSNSSQQQEGEEGTKRGLDFSVIPDVNEDSGLAEGQEQASNFKQEKDKDETPNDHTSQQQMLSEIMQDDQSEIQPQFQMSSSRIGQCQIQVSPKGSRLYVVEPTNHNDLVQPNRDYNHKHTLEQVDEPNVSDIAPKTSGNQNSRYMTLNSTQVQIHQSAGDELLLNNQNQYFSGPITTLQTEAMLLKQNNVSPSMKLIVADDLVLAKKSLNFDESNNQNVQTNEKSKIEEPVLMTLQPNSFQQVQVRAKTAQGMNQHQKLAQTISPITSSNNGLAQPVLSVLNGKNSQTLNAYNQNKTNPLLGQNENQKGAAHFGNDLVRDYLSHTRFNSGTPMIGPTTQMGHGNRQFSCNFMDEVYTKNKDFLSQFSGCKMQFNRDNEYSGLSNGATSTTNNKSNAMMEQLMAMQVREKRLKSLNNIMQLRLKQQTRSKTPKPCGHTNSRAPPVMFVTAPDKTKHHPNVPNSPRAQNYHLHKKEAELESFQQFQAKKQKRKQNDMKVFNKLEQWVFSQ